MALAVRRVIDELGRAVLAMPLERYAKAETLDAADGDGPKIGGPTEGGIRARIGGVSGNVAGKVQKHNDGELKRLGIDLRGAEPKLGGLIDKWRAENVDRVTSLTDFERAKLSEILAKGENKTVKELRERIQDRLEVSRQKADLIARDQVLKLNAKITRERQTAAGITEYIWTTSRDERVRATHEELDGETFSWDDPPVTNEQGDRNHPGEDYQCLPGDAQITLASPVRRAYRRWFRGELTTLVTETGPALQSTPNHPVLTAAGWKPADAVEVGDYVFDVRQQRLGASEGQVEQRKALIADVFGAAALLGVGKRVAGIAAQFHGDGSDEQVQVVDIDGVLVDDVEPALAEQLGQLVFAFAPTPTARGREFELALAALGFPASRSTSCLGDRLANLDRRLGETNDVGFAAPSRDDASALQEIRDGLALDAVAFGENFHGGALSVQLEALILRVVLRVVRASVLTERDDATSAQRLGEIVRVAVESGADLAEQSPVFEHALRVVEKRVSEFSGHVYNLETGSGWYGAAVAVGNCRCVAFPVLPELGDIGNPPEQEPDEPD